MLQITESLKLEYQDRKRELDTKIPSDIRENYEQGSLTSRVNTKPLDWRGSQVGNDPANPLVPYNVWAREQQRLSTKLGLKNVQVYLVHFCSICGQPTKKGAKVDLCEKHYLERRKVDVKKNVRAFRERKGNQE